MMEFCGEQANKTKKKYRGTREYGEILVGNKARISTGTQPPPSPKFFLKRVKFIA
jgi:hypothetical protein